MQTEFRLRTRLRGLADGTATALAVLFTLIVILPLIAIFVYLIIKGASSLNLAFFTKVPAPVGEEGESAPEENEGQHRQIPCSGDTPDRVVDDRPGVHTLPGCCQPVSARVKPDLETGGVDLREPEERENEDGRYCDGMAGHVTHRGAAKCVNESKRT